MKYNLSERKPSIYLDIIGNDLTDLLRDTLAANHYFMPVSLKEECDMLPPVEIKQCDKHYYVSVQLPGIEKDDIKIELEKDYLTISAEKKKEELKEGQSVKSSEFRYGKFMRKISFDKPINIDEAQAHYKNGILTINIPKQEIENSKAKHLEIKD
ncbi:Hsp20/alpha crystallin family protein [bacterium]|nr:Hsp20/alpha crystallin family protein [bacterium]